MPAVCRFVDLSAMLLSCTVEAALTFPFLSRVFSSSDPLSFLPLGDMTNGQTAVASNPVKGPALAIGTLSTAQDGKYQSLVSGLEATRRVDRHLLDRLVEGGERSSFCCMNQLIPTFFRISYNIGAVLLCIGPCSLNRGRIPIPDTKLIQLLDSSSFRSQSPRNSLPLGSHDFCQITSFSTDTFWIRDSVRSAR